jgi:trimethylamine--corrinoid protein Co-methyltransferase
MGMIDNGMTMSYDQLMIDCEIVRMVRRVLQGMPVNKDTLALDVIKEVGPLGSFLTNRHTSRFMRTELSQANLIDRKNVAQWEADGSTTMEERAHVKAVKHFAEYEVTSVDSAIAETLKTIIEKAEAETDSDI